VDTIADFMKGLNDVLRRRDRDGFMALCTPSFWGEGDPNADEVWSSWGGRNPAFEAVRERVHGSAALVDIRMAEEAGAPDRTFYLVKGERSGWFLSWIGEEEGVPPSFKKDLPRGFETPEALVENMNDALRRMDRESFVSTFLPDFWHREGRGMEDLFRGDDKHDFSVRLHNVRMEGDRAALDMVSVMDGEEEGGVMLLLKRRDGGWLVAAPLDLDREPAQELAEAFLQGRAPRLR
ncbi:MAG: nuclear transport factor 2 family protein, partial [Planctomycetota bacterium]